MSDRWVIRAWGEPHWLREENHRLTWELEEGKATIFTRKRAEWICEWKPPFAGEIQVAPEKLPPIPEKPPTFDQAIEKMKEPIQREVPEDTGYAHYRHMLAEHSRRQFAPEENRLPSEGRELLRAIRSVFPDATLRFHRDLAMMAIVLDVTARGYNVRYMMNEYEWHSHREKSEHLGQVAHQIIHRLTNEVTRRAVENY
jgi:hypothetical protein